MGRAPGTAASSGQQRGNGPVVGSPAAFMVLMKSRVGRERFIGAAGFASGSMEKAHLISVFSELPELLPSARYRRMKSEMEADGEKL